MEVKQNIRQYFTHRFIIPAYQRGYKWGVSHKDGKNDAGILVEQIFQSFNEGKEEYFVQGARQGNGASQAFHKQCSPCSRIGVENQTTHHRREEQWSPRQISGVLKKESVSVSHQCIYNLIHADASGELTRHTRHKLKYRRRPKRKPFPIADRTSIHSRPE